MCLSYVPLQTEVAYRNAAFNAPVPLRVAVGTYNINNGKYFRMPNYEGLTVADWLDCYRELQSENTVAFAVFLPLHPPGCGRDDKRQQERRRQEHNVSINHELENMMKRSTRKNTSNNLLKI